MVGEEISVIKKKPSNLHLDNKKDALKASSWPGHTHQMFRDVKV
jgi:hypothetical protein